MNLKIRQYAPEDKEICLMAFKSNVPQFFTFDEIAQFGSWIDKSRATSPNNRYYVATLDGKVVGCGGFVFDEKQNETSLAWGLIEL